MTLLAQTALQMAVGFAIGAGTNELAIRWVFNTLFTKKKRLIAENAKRLIRTELMTAEKIAAKLASPDVKDAVERCIREKVDERGDKVRAVLARCASRVDSLVPSLLREEIKTVAEVADLFDEDIRSTIARTGANQISAHLAESLPRMIEETDVWNIVYETIMGYDEKKLELLAREIANRELRGVTLWGGLIGAAVGLTMSFTMWIIG